MRAVEFQFIELAASRCLLLLSGGGDGGSHGVDNAVNYSPRSLTAPSARAELCRAFFGGANQAGRPPDTISESISDSAAIQSSSSPPGAKRRFSARYAAAVAILA